MEYIASDKTVWAYWRDEAAREAIYTKQNDSGRLLYIAMNFKDGEQHPIQFSQVFKYGETPTNPYTATVKLRFQRADGVLVETEPQPLNFPLTYTDEWYDTQHTMKIRTWEISGIFSGTLPQEASAVPGRVICDAVIKYSREATVIDGETIVEGYEPVEVSIYNFYMDVEAAPTGTTSGGLDPSSPINIKSVSEADFATMEKSENTLYIVKGDTTKLYVGNSIIRDAQTLLNADRIGVFPSYQLFPLDKGTVSAPYEINKSACQFLVNAEYQHGGNGRATIPPYIICAGQTSDTTEITVELEALFNRSYKYADIYPLMGDLMPGDYVFSLEAVEGFQEGFDGTNAELYAQIYKHNIDSPGDDILLCEVAVGETGTFTVAESNRYINIVIVAHRLAGKSWNNEYIMVKPYLRRIEFKDKPYDVYVPSLHKQIATMDLSGGYNETQTDTVTDSVEEVTQ